MITCLLCRTSIRLCPMEMTLDLNAFFNPHPPWHLLAPFTLDAVFLVVLWCNRRLIGNSFLDVTGTPFWFDFQEMGSIWGSKNIACGTLVLRQWRTPEKALETNLRHLQKKFSASTEPVCSYICFTNFVSIPQMMMIAFITFKSSLVPLFEGLWSSNSWEFELSGFSRNRTDDLGIDSPSLWPTEPRLHVKTLMFEDWISLALPA